MLWIIDAFLASLLWCACLTCAGGVHFLVVCTHAPDLGAGNCMRHFRKTQYLRILVIEMRCGGLLSAFLWSERWKQPR